MLVVVCVCSLFSRPGHQVYGLVPPMASLDHARVPVSDGQGGEDGDGDGNRGAFAKQRQSKETQPLGCIKARAGIVR